MNLALLLLCLWPVAATTEGLSTDEIGSIENLRGVLRAGWQMTENLVFLPVSKLQKFISFKKMSIIKNSPSCSGIRFLCAFPSMSSGKIVTTSFLCMFKKTVFSISERSLSLSVP